MFQQVYDLLTSMAYAATVGSTAKAILDCRGEVAREVTRNLSARVTPANPAKVRAATVCSLGIRGIDL